MLTRLAAASCALVLVVVAVVAGAGLADGGGHPVAGTALTVCGGIGAVLAVTTLLGPARRRDRRR